MSVWSCHTKLGNRPAEAAAPTGSLTQRFLVVDLLDTPWLRLDDSEGQQMTSNTNPDPKESAARSSLDQETTSPYVEDHQGQEPRSLWLPARLTCTTVMVSTSGLTLILRALSSSADRT